MLFSSFLVIVSPTDLFWILKRILGQKQPVGCPTCSSCDPAVLSSGQKRCLFAWRKGRSSIYAQLLVFEEKKQNRTKTQKALNIIEACINHFRRTVLYLGENDLHVSEQCSCELLLCYEFLDFFKKGIQPSSFLIFPQNRDGGFFPLVSLKARHRHHYNRLQGYSVF